MTHDPSPESPLPESEEVRLAALLKTVQEVPPPDQVVLDALRQRSSEAFAETSPSERDPADEPPAVVTKVSTPGEDSTVTVSRGSPPTRFSRALRGVVALSIAAAVLAIWLNPWNSPTARGDIPFSQILDEVGRAKSLQLRITKQGRESEVWVRAPGLVRWEDSPQQYRIARGSQLWRIDESENTAVQSESTWLDVKKQNIDLLSLLDVRADDAAPLLASRPVSRAAYDGRDCLVYRVILPGSAEKPNAQPLQIEAFADARDHRLVGIIARAADDRADEKDPRRNAGPPLAELRLVAMNALVGDEKFAVAGSLTQDGRIGKVNRAQGLAAVRPTLAKRWTPIHGELLLEPGDWVRTDPRGANAVELTLSSQAGIILGPGTLLECLSPGTARLYSGEVQILLPQGDRVEFQLLAPREGSRKLSAAGKHLVRVDKNEKLVDVANTPQWLAGFEGTSSNESLGSLIVNLPDGRNEPLAVGYHKVSVEIRDQIARTTIEESFVNHTNNRLEGVFHFPLPQDASISGFGMWIGDDLVEADVVEKQRAREIYETILREKRDPGLLEWTSGNLFKARVFPIEAGSEKRIKIVFTQVLPLRAGRYRYSYGLRSDLLRTRPLRELSLNVTINSALSLKEVTCPTHAARIQRTDHAAQVEFAAQDYTPTRDFEVVSQIDERQSDVVVVSHRRDEDGYFLLQITPPATEGNWSREVLPEGEPLHLAILCDTSGSMDSEKRKQQSEFVVAVLAALGPDDRFQLAAADVGTVWAVSEPVAVTAENVAQAKSFLEQRQSLGWTDLDRAFVDVLKKAPDRAHVIYVGDGIISAAGETDAAAFVKRLENRIAELKSGKTAKQATLHAITVGNTSESVALKGIATAGGGSVRNIGGEQTPSAVAMELLSEIARPGLRDANVQFRGLKVAAVYPDRMPNIAAGMQQILVGRYLPEGKDQQGEVVVTGQRGGERVQYAARIALAEAETGNSFIPRLWARAHLDHLLEQGQSETIRDEIIRLSEEFHIITPYTSLLVLETDADRERFAVQRRFEMRDGEKFFATGRQTANYELAQQQMKRAGSWRRDLRLSTLRQFSTLGRDPRIWQSRGENFLGRAGRFSRDDGWETFDRKELGELRTNLSLFVSQTQELAGFGGDSDAGVRLITDGTSTVNFDSISDLAALPFAGDSAETDGGRPIRGRFQEEWSSPDYMNLFLSDASVLNPERGASFGGRKRIVDELRQSVAVSDPFGTYDTYEMRLLGMSVDEPAPLPASSFGDFQTWRGDRVESEDLFEVGQAGGEMGYSGYSSSSRSNYTSWIHSLFPHLPAPPRRATTTQALPNGWSPEAIAISKSLLRTESLTSLEGGLELRRVSETFDPRWNRRWSRHSDLVLYSPTAWLTRTLNTDANPLVNYCDEQERGAFSQALLLGTTRKMTAQELRTAPFALNDLSLSPLHESYRQYQARVEPAGEKNRVKLIVTFRDSSNEQHFLVDTARHVVLRHESFNEGVLTGTTAYEDIVELAGRWWSKKQIVTDARGRKIGETSFEIQTLSKEQYAQKMNAELAARPQVQFVHLPLVKLSVARQKAADGSAGFDERLKMVLYYAAKQDWEELWRQVDALEKLAVDKPGVPRIRTQLLITSRRNEEGRQRMLDEATQLAAKPQLHEIYLADFLLSQAYSVSGWQEYLVFVQLLKPVYERQPAELGVLTGWQERLAQCYDSLGRPADALAIGKTLAEQSPWNISRQIDYAQRLARSGESTAGFAWLQGELDRKIERDDSEDSTLRTAYAQLLRERYDWEGLLKFTTEWIGKNPANSSAYQQHLSALIYNDKLDVANTLAEQWLKESLVDGKLASVPRAKLDAAVNFARGSCYDLSFYRMDDRWLRPLADAARIFVRNKYRLDTARTIVDSSRFGESDVCDRLRGDFLAMLQGEVANLSPDQIQSLVSWTLTGRIEPQEPIGGRKQLPASEVPLEIWQKIAAGIRERWAKSEVIGDRHALGEALRSIYSQRFAEAEYLPFLRERLGSAPVEYKATYRQELFHALLAHPWTEEVEQELFQRLRELGKEDAVARAAGELPAAAGDVPAADDTAKESRQAVAMLTIQVPTLYQVVDKLIASRLLRSERELQDQGETHKLTRKELAAKRAEFAKAARNGVAARLGAEAEKEPGPLTPWLKIEQAWLDIQLGQRHVEAEQLCWRLLGETPPQQKESDELDTLDIFQIQQRRFDAILQRRALATVKYLATRPKAEPATVDRVLKYVDAGIKQGGESAAGWRNTKFQLLVALDRPDDLERELREWIRVDVSTAPWRIMLARLCAERSKLDEAIQLFEAAQKDKLLSADDYRLLADCYLVVNRREAYERARIEAFKSMSENELSNRLNQTRQRWSRSDSRLPSELDEETLFVVRALLEKSSSPESYLAQIRGLYAASRDFRLLDMLPDVVQGRSQQQIYPFLRDLQNQVISEVHNEATADEVLVRVRLLREKSPTPTDLRALDLMEAVVERKSSEVLNQPAPHIDACLAALRRAFERKWAEGEPRQMANYLNSLGTLHHPSLVDEQLRELRELQGMVPAASRDHLWITSDMSNLLFGSYQRKDEAIRMIEAEVNAYQQANQGKWPHDDIEVLGSYVSLLERTGRYAEGELVLHKLLPSAQHDSQRQWIRERLESLYNDALANDGTVSLGKGTALFQSLVNRSLQELDAAADEGHRQRIITRLIATYEVGQRRKLEGVNDQVRKFAFETMPAVLKRQHSQYRNTVMAPLSIITEILGPQLALQYVVERMEQYPQRFEIGWESAWSVFGYELARRREELVTAKKEFEELNPRILKLTIRELKRDLQTGESRHRNLYHKENSYYWAEKSADYARAANEVYGESRSSGRRVPNIADYLWRGLGLRARAIEVMLLAHQNGILDEANQGSLITYLQAEERYGESIPLLEKLISVRPDQIEFRTQLMIAYFYTQRHEQLAEAVKQTDSHFHGGSRWVENNVAALAEGCIGCELLESAANYYQEAIALRQRSNSGPGDGSLAYWYRRLSHAYSKLGRLQEAVDAASGAIVGWGLQQSQRQVALDQLNHVLREAKEKDLDVYLQKLDEQTAKSGQDSPILRKALGQVFQARGQNARAIVQYQLAIALQPHDEEVHQALVTCYDATKAKDQATQQLLRWIDVDRHDLTLYRQLAERLRDNEAEADRAATSMIEAAPGEAENHSAFAELRQQQNRWEDAIPHWQRVAELRRLEPTGLLKLAEAQVHLQQWPAAMATIEKLQRTQWPARFGEVSSQTRNLQEQLPKP